MRERRESPLWKILLTVLLLCTTMAGHVGVTSAVDPPDISVDPLNSAAKTGQTFTINLTVYDVTLANSFNGIYIWEVHVNFSASILQVVGAEEGPFLKDNWNKTIWGDPSIDNTNGTIGLACAYYDYGGLSSGALCPGTTKVLANITFQAVGAGNSDLQFYDTELLTYVGEHILDLPYGHTTTDGSVTVTSGHDVAVVDVTAPDEVALNSSVPIEVTVKNEGDFTENVNVTVRYDSTYIDSENFTNLAGGTQNTTTFTWDTTGVSKGVYTINATAAIPVENDPTDNWKNVTIRIVEHDVAVIEIEAPQKAKPGEQVPINVTVKNQGSHTEEANVTIRYASTYIDSDNLTLTKGENQTAYLTWNTTSLSLGDYIINANVTIPLDDDPTDNNKTKTVTLYLTHDVAVMEPDAPTFADLGDQVSINVTVKNKGDYSEDVNITITYFQTYIDSENFTVAKEQNHTSYFTWNTSGLAPANYQIEANASILPVIDDHLGDNYNTTTVILRTHDVNATSITAPSSVYPNFNVTINVTVTNQGSYKETVNLTLTYNNTLIGNVTFDVFAFTSKNVSVTWDTTGVSYGNYILTANATVLDSFFNPGGIDDDPSDNILVDGWILVTIPGDIDGDGDVDKYDFGSFAGAFGSYVGDARYNPGADLNGDGDVDKYDFGDFAGNYGQSI